jgi:hypothetical protein
MRILLMLAVMSSVAAAEPAKTSSTVQIKDAKQMVTDDCAKARKAGRTCVLDMGTEDVKGGVPTSTGTSINTLKMTTEPSLIHLRRDFIVEIVKSAEDLD